MWWFDFSSAFIVYHFSIVFNRFSKKCINIRIFVYYNKKLLPLTVRQGIFNIIESLVGIILWVIKC